MYGLFFVVFCASSGGLLVDFLSVLVVCLVKVGCHLVDVMYSLIGFLVYCVVDCWLIWEVTWEIF